MPRKGSAGAAGATLAAAASLPGRDPLAGYAFRISLAGLPIFRGSILSELSGLALIRRVLVYTGFRTLTTPEGIEVWPVRTFLEALASDDLWP